jgi:predicted nucleic acid-binding protein
LILADTNVWSETMKPVCDRRVIDWIDRHWDDLGLSAIVLAELCYGVAKTAPGRRRDALARQVERIQRHKAHALMGFGAPEAKAYGMLMSQMRAAGTPLPILDGQIAAQAIAGNHALATRNVADFARTGIALMNPWE